MVDLARWLGIQLDEDERIARAATPGPWRHDPSKHHHIVGTPLFEEAVFAGPSGSAATCVAGTGDTDDQQSMADAAFIAAHDPARVLREIDAKRKALDHYAELQRLAKGGVAIYRTAAGAVGVQMQIMALAYADRPGYQEAWRPEHLD